MEGTTRRKHAVRYAVAALAVGLALAAASGPQAGTEGGAKPTGWGHCCA